MDFVNNSSPQQGSPAPSAAQGHNKQTVKSRKMDGKTMRMLSFALLVMIALIVGLAALLAATSDNRGEQKYVDKDKLQAVFLNGGQVYFGKIHALNSKYITLDNIYYLRVNQQVQPNQTANATDTANAQDVSLAKLGCELHGPTDAMVINRDQVLFWENLKADGQVAKAVADYVKANPNGQKCTDTSAANTDTTTNKQ